MPLSIAIDVMGGDIGPSATVPAACNLANVYPDIEFLLYGEHALCQPFISSPLPLNIRFIATTDSVLMEDLPAHALRHKRHSSMGAALNAVALGQASGCVSAGNTGALLAMGIHFLGLFDGIDRPVLCQSLPVQGRTTPTYMLDLGANVDVEAKHLLQFACLGAALSSLLHDVPSPVVKLLNVGAESNKGSLCVKQAAEMMAVVSPLNYQGFVEGGDIYSGVADVIVCDGFAGNIALKVSEGVARLVMKEFALLLQSSILGRCLFYWSQRCCGKKSRWRR